MTAFPLLWLIGPSAVGKSTIGHTTFRMLAAAGVNSAFVDGDQLGLCYPAPDGDPGNHHLRAANLATVWRGYRSAGAECLILSGYVWTTDEVKLYTDAVPGMSLTLCRLRASRSVHEERYLHRGWMPEHLPDALREADDLDAIGLPAHVIETDGLSPHQIAQQICGPTGIWPMPSAHRTATRDV
ncbi:hypothetical protein [Catenulispora subtropica]|uniref:Uncharacterized protein n=1 Tax=Catenulispora subtropica TaxID=450798 RepID=A0ABN2QML7_9ACTN